MKSKIAKLIFLFIILCATACITTIFAVYYPEFQIQQLQVREEYKDIIGDWKEYFIFEDTIQASAIRRFALDENENLVQSYQYELGSQSRIWIDITDVHYENGRLTIWNEFDGHINKSKDTIFMVYSPKRGGKYNLVMEKLGDNKISRFIDSLPFARSIEYKYEVPPNINDGIDCGSLGIIGVDTSKINQLIDKIKNGSVDDIHSLLLWKDGNLVLEEYFASNGVLSGPIMNNHYRYKTQQLASVTKSINSLAFGIAVDKRLIESTNIPLYEIFPEYAIWFDDDKRKITLEHLLTMSAGLEWNELSISYSNSNNDVNLMHSIGDLVKYCLAKPVTNKPGEKFNYHSGIATILGEVIKRKTGKSVDEFMGENLFDPLGITQYEWWKDKKDKNKVVGTGGGLSLTSRDLLKIGILTLNKGSWNGVSIISKEWIENSTMRKISTGTKWYGYQWWSRDFTFKNKTLPCFYAMGNGAKFLFLFPEINLIVVTTAENYNRGWSNKIYNLIQEYILAAVYENY